MRSMLTIARRLVQVGVQARQNLNTPGTQIALAVAALTFGVRALGAVLENAVDALEERQLVDEHRDKRLQALEESVFRMKAAAGKTYPEREDLDPLQRGAGETPVYAAAAADGVPTFGVDEVFPEVGEAAASFDGFSVVAGDGR